jgi:hypothetical protein
MGPDE